MTKDLLYITTTLPTPGYGSSVILYRHLKRLKDWKISILVDDDSALARHYLPTEWGIFRTLEPKWWWPPVRRKIPGFLGVRCRMLVSKYEKVIKQNRPDAILTQLGKNSLLAFCLSKRTGIPLNVIVHDRWQAWSKYGGIDRYLTDDLAVNILDHASRVWPVSGEMARYYKVRDKKKVRVLYPIPEGSGAAFAEWKDAFRKRPVAIFAGSYHSCAAPVLRACAEGLRVFGGQLWIITKRTELIKKEAGEQGNIKYFEASPKNEELLAFMRDNASAVLIAGSIDTRAAGWELSFPSRLVEFVHTGLPVIVAGREGTALSSWAKSRRWKGYVDIEDGSSLKRIMGALLNRENWEDLARQSRDVAMAEFNPERIQEQFERELVGGARDKSTRDQGTSWR